MSKLVNDSFQVVGISIRTSNQNGKAAIDIPAHWNRFMSEGLFERIPKKESDDIYALYTNYEGDHNLPYDFIIGCRVEDDCDLPEGMISLKVPESTFEHIAVKGNLEKGKIVFEAWQKIWASGMERAYTVDYEVYGEKSQDMENAELDIYVSI